MIEKIVYLTVGMLRRPLESATFFKTAQNQIELEKRMADPKTSSNGLV